MSASFVTDAKLRARKSICNSSYLAIAKKNIVPYRMYCLHFSMWKSKSSVHMSIISCLPT